MLITSAFTCTGPYAILIMLGIKRVENRSALPVRDHLIIGGESFQVIR